MWNKIRIISWVCLLVGGSFYFYIWSQRELDEIFTYNTESTQTYTPISHIEKQDVKAFDYSSTTDVVLLRDKEFSSSSELTIFDTGFDYNDTDFLYPKKDQVMYTGCTYDISLDFKKENKLSYMGIQLFDYGNKKTISSVNSGLNFSKTVSNGKFKWSVSDNLWPGEYYLYVPFIDGVKVGIRSYRFNVEKNVGYCE